MILEFANISLHRLRLEDIETVRHWRNDYKIARHMFFQEHITKEMQLYWFNSLDPDADYYFLIYYKGQAIGLTHISDIDASSRSGNAGLFIYDHSYWGTHIPVMASVALLEFCFLTLNLNEVYAKVRRENEAARSYNHQLGFKEISPVLHVLNRDSYMHVTLELKQKLLQLR